MPLEPLKRPRLPMPLEPLTPLTPPEVRQKPLVLLQALPALLALLLDLPVHQPQAAFWPKLLRANNYERLISRARLPRQQEGVVEIFWQSLRLARS